MDFEKAISVHANLKTRLATYVGGRSLETFDPQRLARDDLCTLGEALHAEAGVMAGQPEFDALMAAHRQFHLCAAEIVSKAITGDQRGAIRLLELGPYTEVSGQVLALLRLLAARARAESEARVVTPPTP